MVIWPIQSLLGCTLVLIKCLLLKVRLLLLSVFSECAYSCLAYSPDALNELRMRGRKSTRSIKGQYQEKFESDVYSESGSKNYKLLYLGNLNFHSPYQEKTRKNKKHEKSLIF